MGIATHELPNQGVPNEWLTPPAVLRELGKFDLDPCSPIDRPWDTAAAHFTQADDGLQQEWYGRVWLNPPYGREVGDWLAKLARHGDGIALIFARTETKAFQRWVFGQADACLFLAGRLKFIPLGGRMKGYAGAPSVLIAYGQRNVEALRRCGLPGKLVVL